MLTYFDIKTPKNKFWSVSIKLINTNQLLTISGFKMEKKVKLAILCLVLAISPMPIAIFSIIHWEHIDGFFDGSAVVKRSLLEE